MPVSLRMNRFFDGYIAPISLDHIDSTVDEIKFCWCLPRWRMVEVAPGRYEHQILHRRHKDWMKSA